MDALEQKIWQLCEEGKALSRAREERERKAALEAEARKPKLISDQTLPAGALRANAERAVDRAMEAERREWEGLTTEQRRYRRMHQEMVERARDPHLVAQDKIDAWMETRLRIERHERWLARRGARVDRNGNVSEYHPIMAFCAEQNDD